MASYREPHERLARQPSETFVMPETFLLLKNVTQPKSKANKKSLFLYSPHFFINALHLCDDRIVIRMRHIGVLRFKHQRPSLST